MVEFAIILGLIVLSAVAAMSLVGDESSQTFARLDGLSGRDQPRAAADFEPSKTTSDVAPFEEPAPVAAEAERPEIRLDARTLTALFGGTAILAYGALRISRRKRSSVVEVLEEGREFLERIDEKRFAKRQDIFKAVSADPQALLENRLEVRHIMSSRLRHVRPKTPLAEIKAIMADDDVRHFPVVSEKGTLVGIVSDRDLFIPDARFAADVMSRSVVTVSPAAKLETAAAQMINRNLSCLPVMENSTLVGIVTTTDLVMTLQCAFQIWRRQTRSADKGPGCVAVASCNDLPALAATNGCG